jgi:hypothetical protein
MMQVLKKSYTLTLLLAVLFFFSVLVTGYHLYSLRYNVTVLMQGSTAIIPLYSWFTVTVSIGSITILLSFVNRKEVIIYRNRREQTSTKETRQPEVTGTEISREALKLRLTEVPDDERGFNSAFHVICETFEACQGALYFIDNTQGEKMISLKAGYALPADAERFQSKHISDGLVGQVAANGQAIYLDDIPEGYIPVTSGLGKTSAKYLLIVPVAIEERITAVVELASFNPISNEKKLLVQQAGALLLEKLLNPVAL